MKLMRKLFLMTLVLLMLVTTVSAQSDGEAVSNAAKKVSDLIELVDGLEAKGMAWKVNRGKTEVGHSVAKYRMKSRSTPCFISINESINWNLKNEYKDRMTKEQPYTLTSKYVFNLASMKRGDYSCTDGICRLDIFQKNIEQLYGGSPPKLIEKSYMQTLKDYNTGQKTSTSESKDVNRVTLYTTSETIGKMFKRLTNEAITACREAFP